METHTPLPDVQNLQRICEVVAGFVKQAIPQAAAQNHAHHPQEQNIFDIFAAPRAGAGDGGKRRMPQAANAQEHEQAKSGQVGQSIPVDGQRAELQGDRVDLGVHQHGQYSALPLWRINGSPAKRAGPMPGLRRR